MVIFLL